MDRTSLRMLWWAALFAVVACIAWPALDVLIPVELLRPSGPLTVEIDPPLPPAPAWSSTNIDWERTWANIGPRKAFRELDAIAQVTPAWRGQLLSACPSGCDYQVICGATCSSATSTCVAGSAIASITDSSVTKPYVVAIGPGAYNECVAITQKSYITLLGAGDTSSLIRPTVTAAGDVAGGVIKIAEVAGAANDTRAIEITGMTVHNDAYGAPEAAIQVGQEATGSDTWNDVYLHDLTAIGHHDAIQWFGRDGSGESTAPRLFIGDVRVVGGRDTVVDKGWANVRMWNIEGLTDTAYCDSSNVNVTDLRTGVVSVTGADTTHFTLTGEVTTTDVWVGRRVVLTDTDGGGAGVCGATNALDTDQFWITDSTSALLVTITPAAAEAPTAGCTYTIDAVPNANQAKCTDIDWTTIAANSSNGNWKVTAFHMGIAQNNNDPIADAAINMRDSSFKIRVRDFGPSASVACTGQSHVAGLLGYNTTAQDNRRRDVIFDNVNFQIDLDVDLQDNQTCASPVAIVDFSSQFESLGKFMWTGRGIVNNNADSDITVKGIASASLNGTGTVVVPSAHLELNGTSGSEVHLFQANTSGLTRGHITSNDELTTSGTIGLLPGASSTGKTTLDFASALTQACSADLTITVPGAADGDSCAVSPVNASIPASSQFNCWVSAANTVSVRHCCNGSAASCDPASGVFRATVTRH